MKGESTHNVDSSKALLLAQTMSSCQAGAQCEGKQVIHPQFILFPGKEQGQGWEGEMAQWLRAWIVLAEFS